MGDSYNKYTRAAKARASVVRLRTWSLTVAILVCLGFYLVVSVTTKQSINWVDFILLCIAQLVIYSIYFPDGDLYGQKDIKYISNRNAYNLKATAINQNKQIAKLREYCKVEYETRKKTYIANQCGILGITLEELELLKQEEEEKIKKIKTYTIKEKVNGEEKEKILIFSKAKRKILVKLLYKPLPVEENFPETIMSAVENKGNKAIKDGSVEYKTRSYVTKIFRAVVIGAIFAYIGYTVKDGFGITEVITLLMYITTMFTTAVMAYTSGENCSKIYKSRFYLELAIFIDSFQEWYAQNVGPVPEITETQETIIETTDSRLETETTEPTDEDKQNTELVRGD